MKLKDLTDLKPADVADFFVAGALISIFWYWGRPGSYHRFPVFGEGPLQPYAWWALSSLVLRIGVPMAVVVWIYREPLADYGFKLVDSWHRWVYVVFYACMLPIVVTVSFWKEFQHTYPFCDAAADDVQTFVIYEVLYGIQFLGVEAFFRGWLLFRLYKMMGDRAVLVMMLPYMMIHLGKPPQETFAAMVAGILLGVLALRSGTWVHGFWLHWAVAITMDLASILQKGGFGARYVG